MTKMYEDMDLQELLGWWDYVIALDEMNKEMAAIEGQEQLQHEHIEAIERGEVA